MTLRVLSLGAGVQSTTMALMAAHGELGPMPDVAIFADTGDEPAAVYDHLAWLMSGNVLPFPVSIVRKSEGGLFASLQAGDEAARIPFHVGAGGISGRQCTRNWKIRPIRREIRRLLGKGPRDYIGPGAVESWIGISTDEYLRIKGSGAAFIKNRHPLIEAGISRRDCERWLRANGYSVPCKSACVYCPFQSNAEWKDKRENDAPSWAMALRVDDWLGQPAQVKRFRGRLYVHPSRVPLLQADLDPRSAGGAQPDLFNVECEGMCGI